LPLKVSVVNDWYNGALPIYIIYAVYVPELVNVWMVYPPELVTVPPVPRCAPV
jgi:hypothetical protein